MSDCTRRPTQLTERIERPVAERSWAWNFSLTAIYQVIARTGWIFKTESIIMPAVLDVLGGGGWLRGCLPMLNRFGQSLPPLLASDRIRRMRLKKRFLAFCGLGMGSCFLLLAAVWGWTGGESSGWLAGFFLVVYATFFIFVGWYNLTVRLLDGKLIPVRARGRLMLVAMTVGCASAVSCAWWLLRGWLSSDPPRFHWIFLFTGTCFVVTAGITLLLRERPDEPTDAGIAWRAILRAVGPTLRADRNFFRLALIASAFGMGLTLFPHYQALARGRLELSLTALVPWVIAQNIGAAGFSIPLGWLADRFGNRLVLQIEMLILATTPLLAILLSRVGSGPYWFMGIFFLLGLTPVTMRTFSHYTLELANRQHQPRFLSTLNLALAGPVILTSSAVGWLVDRFGFELAFGLVMLLICQFRRSGWA